MLNWKAPGRDQIVNFCLKQLTATHTYVATICNTLTEGDQNSYSKKCKQRKTKELQTHNLPAQNIQNYDIYPGKETQKNTGYKNLIPKEWKGCHTGRQECKDINTKSNITGM